MTTQQEQTEFDWNPKEFGIPFPPEPPVSIMQVESETAFQRKQRMLLPLARTCTACSMCDLGLKPVERNGVSRDPHVFSNCHPTRFMVVGQGPGFNEVVKREPFVGEAGETFNAEITKHGLTRKDFYISNAIKCFIQNNLRPTAKQLERCRPFLEIEISLIKPLLVIALGAVAFEQLCPGQSFADSFRKVVKSRYDVPVIPAYHPSPLNLKEASRQAAFVDQIKLIASLIKALKKRHRLD